MTLAKREVSITVKLTPEEQEVYLKYCFLRVFKTAIEQLELAMTGQILDGDKISICIEDLSTMENIVEGVRTKVTEAVRIAYETNREPPENAEWDRLLPKERVYLLDIIKWAHIKHTAESQQIGDGIHAEEYYASPRPGGGISWGRNGPPYGWNTHRGVILDVKEWMKSKGR